MCDSVLPGYSCAEAPIDSNVVPAYDEHYRRRDQTYIPTRYVTACEGEGCHDSDAYACDATGVPECNKREVATIEHMRGGGGGRGGGGRGGGRHYGGGRHSGRGWGGYPYWRSSYYPYWYDYYTPYYYDYPYVQQAVKVVEPVAAPRMNLNPWLLPIGVALAVLYLARR